MNVAPGDLAIVVGDTTSRGAIGEVVKYYGHLKNPNMVNEIILDVWLVQFPRYMQGINVRTGKRENNTRILIRDAYLKRILGPDLLLSPEEVERDKLLEFQ